MAAFRGGRVDAIFAQDGTRSDKDDIFPLDDNPETITSLRESIGRDIQIGDGYAAHKGCPVPALWFDFCIYFVTFANTICMGLEADNPEWTDVWLVTENFFTACFVIEMIVKLIGLRCKYFEDKAHWLDGSLTVLAVLDCWILSPIGGDADLQSFSVLRILRLARLARILKLVRGFKPMVLVIKGVAQTVSTTLYVFLLLLIIFYVFAIFLTEHLGRGQNMSEYPGYSLVPEVIDEQEVMMNYNPALCFGSMADSMLTLFNMAILAEWQEIVRPIAVKQPMYLLVFVLFAVFVGFGVLNVMIGLILDKVITESKRMDDEFHQSVLKRKLRMLDGLQKLLTDMDSNGDGVIGLHELSSAMEDNRLFKQYLSHIDLPSGWSPAELLEMLDRNYDGELDEHEFVTSFFRLIDSNEFQQMCILQAGINQVKSLVAAGSRTIQGRLSGIEADVRALRHAFCTSSAAQALLHDDLRGAPRIADGDIARHMGLDIKELRRKIEDDSHDQLMVSLDAAYSAMKASFQKELAAMTGSPDLQPCVQPSAKADAPSERSGLDAAGQSRLPAYLGMLKSLPAEPSLLVQVERSQQPGHLPPASDQSGLHAGLNLSYI